MDEDEKKRLARKGLALIDAADPKNLKKQFTESARDAASEAVLEGVRTVSRWTGSEESVAGPKQEVDLTGAMDAMQASTFASFDARLRATQRDPKQRERVALRTELKNVRRSFPEESKELAVLVFACVDLLADLQTAASGGAPVAPEELIRREQLLTRIATLLAPNAGEALTSFVQHVVELSRRTRASSQ